VRRHFFLLKQLVQRDFQGRYAGSLLGFVWSFVQPLWMLLLFTYVFSTVMKIGVVAPNGPHFALFLFGGLLPWMALQEGVLRSATVIQDNANLVKKLQFPAEILVLAVVLAALLHEAIAAVLFVVVLLWHGELHLASLPWLLVALPLQVALTLGLGLFLGAIQVFFRDTAQVVGMVFTGWFYLTPIVYPLAQVPERFRPWVEANPLTGLVGLYRQALLGDSFFGTGGLSLAACAAILALAATLALTGGYLLFHRLKPAFVDEI
jgi:lipopolysaccharide transport system permease protein